MSDTRIRALERRGELTARDLARAGLCAVRRWDGRGCSGSAGRDDFNGSGYGDGRGCARGHGHGHGGGCGDGGGGRRWGDGTGCGDGGGLGDGYGYGKGSSDGYGHGHGEGGPGYSHGEGGCGVSGVDYTDLIPAGTPVVLRTYTSGVVVGRLRAGAGGVVALLDWRWLIRWSGVGGEGSVYDLVASSVAPEDRGPLTAGLGIFQQADVMVVSEAVYRRLAT